MLPPGRVVSAVKPAAMRMWMTYPMTIVDTIFKALAPALPEQVIAGHHADLCVGRINGRRPKDDSFYIYLGGLIGGGWGAKHNSDGRNAVIAMNDGDTHNGPSEQVEAKYPLLVERYCLRPDSGGAGRFRGGLGAEQVVQARHPIRFSSLMERARCKPWGLFGGLSGSGNAVAVHRFGQHRRDAFPERQGAQPGAAAGRRLHHPLRRRRRLRLAAASATSKRSSTTCAAATSPRRPRRNTTARCSSRIRSRSTSGRRNARRASMKQQGLPHDEPITEIIIPFPTARAAAGPRARAREADRRGARGVRDAVPLLLLGEIAGGTKISVHLPHNSSAVMPGLDAAGPAARRAITQIIIPFPTTGATGAAMAEHEKLTEP